MACIQQRMRSIAGLLIVSRTCRMVLDDEGMTVGTKPQDAEARVKVKVTHFKSPMVSVVNYR